MTGVRRNHAVSRIFLGLLSLLAFLCLAVPAQAEILRGRVVGVADGDSITLLDHRQRQHKIRLAGIDAPEKGQPYGQRSKQALSALVYGKTVAVEATKRDRYGRRVGKVWVDDAVDASLQQLLAGMAWHYKAYEREQSRQDRDTYALAQERARESRQGLWRDAQPLPPWEWRRQRREAATRARQ